MTAVYARQSVERADSISIETQIDRCKSRLTAGELADCRVYTDRGFSGKNTARPAFQSLLSDIEAGQIGKIVVYKLDRVSRSVHDFTGLCELLGAKNVAFLSCEDGLTLDETPAGAAMAQIMMVFAQFERETIVRRVTDNYYERAKSGMYLGGRPPFGFVKGQTAVLGKKTACFAPDPDTAPLVRALFERYLDPDASLGTLMRWLNDELRLPTGRGGAWSTVQLGRLLRNPAYARADALVYRYLRQKGAQMNDPVQAYAGERGCYLYAPREGRTKSKFADLNGAFVSLAPHRGLVEADIWLRAQQKLDQNRALKNTGRGAHSFLSGIMKCAHCGYAVTVVNKPAPHREHYINCGGRKKGAAICPGRSRPMTLEQIEGAVESVLLRFLKSYAAVPLRPAPIDRAAGAKLDTEIVTLEQEAARLSRNLALIDLPDVVRQTARDLHEKNERLAALHRERDALAAPQSDTALERFFAAVPDEWPTYTIEQKKRIARIALERVDVGDGEVTVTFAAGFGDSPLSMDDSL